MNGIKAGKVRLQVSRINRMAHTAIRDPYAFSPHFKYIFIFSHMRAYTTLLAHLLGNSPEISGYFELHQPYRGTFDFLSMRVRISEGVDYHVRGRYLLDKILHNYEISPQVLELERMHMILMLREPARTLKSLMSREAIQSVEHALDYYLSRMRYLEHLSIIGKHKLYVDSGDVVKNTSKVLDALVSFLNLKNNLSSNYSVNKFTGLRGYGDNSIYIKQGQVIKEGNPINEIDIPRDILLQAEENYLRTRQILMKNCLTIEKMESSS